MRSKTELREISMKAIYQVYIYESTNVKYNINDIIKELLEVENPFVNELVNGVVSKQDELTVIADKYLINWNVDRLSKVDKAIISMAIYELTYMDTPPLVVINEAIELSKKYSDEKVTKMINAALDKYYHGEIDGR